MNITALMLGYFDKSGGQNNQTNLLVANAIYYVIENFFGKMAPSFVLTLCCRNSYTCNFHNDLLEKLFGIWIMPEPLLQIVVVPVNNTQLIPGLRDYNLILTDSFKSILEIDIISYTGDNNYNEFYYIVLQTRYHLLYTEMQKIFEYCWAHYLINCNIQIQNSHGEVLIYTYFPFTPEHCGKVKPVLINQYNGLKFLVDEIFPKKLRNFHGCSLNAVAWHVPPFIYLKTNNDGSNSMSGGFEAELLQELAKRLNFNIVIKKPPNNEQRGSIVGSSVTGALGMLLNRSVDLSLGAFRLTAERNHIVTAIQSYYQTSEVVGILESDYTLTFLESLIYPFQPQTWFLLLGISISFFIVKVIIKKSYLRLPNDFKSFRLDYSYLNFLLMTLGMPATYISTCFCGRLNSMNWMFFALIIRTVYQALLFHLIRTHQHSRLPQTWDDLVDNNYTLVMNRATFDALISVPFIHQLQSLVINSTSDTVAFEYKTNTSTKFFVAAGPVDFLMYFGRKQHLAGAYKVLPQHIIEYQITMYLSKHSFLVDHFNGEVMWMRAVGLLTAWSSKELDFKYLRSDHILTEQAFGLEQLSVIFSIGAVALIGALLVFILEVLSKCGWILRNIYL